MRRLRESAFKDALTSLDGVIRGTARARIVDEVLKSKSFDRSVRHLRDGMRAHRFDGGGETIFAAPWVKQLDHLTRADGFHILHDWDGKADRFCDDTIPVEVAIVIERIADPIDHAARRSGLAILLDYYLLHLLALAALRVWDEGDANANLDAVDTLLGDLQGPNGSGQKFARDAATLILIATSHFEPDVTAYDRLLERIQKMNGQHRLDMALTHGAILGSHLRFGLEITCAGSVAALRDDNIPDYPWLAEALATLLEAYDAVSEAVLDDRSSRIVEALLVALTPDPDAFLGRMAPASLNDHLDRRAVVVNLFTRHRESLLRDFASHRPVDGSYSPLAFTFNFPHNLVKGIAVDAILRGTPWSLGLDDLLSALPSPAIPDSSRLELARRLMGYAIASPDTIRGRPHPAIVYDPGAGVRTFENIMRRLST